MRSDWQRSLTHAGDRFASDVRFVLIITVIVANGILEEALILCAELMMLLRWSRDTLRYEVRWTVQEKLRLLTARQQGSMKD
jgi:hypothetical protein